MRRLLQLHAPDPEAAGRVAGAVVHPHLGAVRHDGQRLERLVLQIECDQAVGERDEDAPVRHRRRRARTVVERDRPVASSGRIPDMQCATVDVDPEQTLRACVPARALPESGTQFDRHVDAHSAKLAP